jgi:histone H3/H4
MPDPWAAHCSMEVDTLEASFLACNISNGSWGVGEAYAELREGAGAADGNESDGDESDGDESDGDESDGDESDGDESDGDESDGDESDGDNASEGDGYPPIQITGAAAACEAGKWATSDEAATSDEMTMSTSSGCEFSGGETSSSSDAELKYSESGSDEGGRRGVAEERLSGLLRVHGALGFPHNSALADGLAIAEHFDAGPGRWVAATEDIETAAVQLYGSMQPAAIQAPSGKRSRAMYEGTHAGDPPARRQRRLYNEHLALEDIRTEQQDVRAVVDAKLFADLARALCAEVSPDLEMSDNACAALQAAAEDYLIRLFEGTNLAAIHAGRDIIRPADMQLARALREAGR